MLFRYKGFYEKICQCRGRRIIVIAREAGAVYKVGNSALINTELFEKYLERFREPARELPKHTWNKLKEMTNTPKTGENS